MTSHRKLKAAAKSKPINCGYIWLCCVRYSIKKRSVTCGRKSPAFFLVEVLKLHNVCARNKAFLSFACKNNNSNVIVFVKKLNSSIEAPLSFLYLMHLALWGDSILMLLFGLE